MTSFKVLLVLLLCSRFATCQETTCEEETICVVNEQVRESECQQYNGTTIVSSLSNITLKCTTVHIYVASGTHILNGLVYFNDSVEETHIDGAFHSQESKIMCINKAGIRFSENRNVNNVFLSNLAFTHCGKLYVSGWKETEQAALHFKYASYSLENVVVQNTEGYGIHAQQCQSHTIIKCTFNGNTQGHIHISIRKDAIYTHTTKVEVQLTETEFIESKGEYAAYIQLLWSIVTVRIRNSTFTNNANGGLYILGAKHLEIKDCRITNNKGSGIEVDMFTDPNIKDIPIIVDVNNCLVENNSETGIIVNRRSNDKLMYMKTDISNVTFINNSRALYLSFYSWNEANEYRVTKISECRFTNHRLSPKLEEKSVLVFKNKLLIVKNNKVTLENCSFKENQAPPGAYSVLYVHKMVNLTVNNVDIFDNDCTGIALHASKIKIKNQLNLNRNSGWQGGGISMYSVSDTMFSQLSLEGSSRINIINNNAETYGGGIFTDETCEERNRNHTCFFQFETTVTTPASVFKLSGNRAKLGGDMMLGGCLFNCSLRINKTWINIDKTNPKNILWDLLSFKNVESQSTFAEYPKRAMFCTNTSMPANTSTLAVDCTDSYTVSAFRGQALAVPLMAGDDLCFPTERVLKVKGEENLSLLLEGQVIETTKYCQDYSYALAGVLGQNISTVEVYFKDPLATTFVPSILTVHLKDCPAGLKLDYTDELCRCHGAFKLHRIECHSDTYTLEVPAQTWVGKYEGHNIMIVQKECQYCKNEASVLSLDKVTDELCTANRSGLMCGQCIEGLSLKLGGYECDRCSKSPLVGVALVIAFTSAGVALVFLLLGLNLTISTGALNGLIFYSNIVYLNSDIFLPVNREGSTTHLQNAVKVLSTFQAWMNLDFGITTCFFDGYNTYISTWMQFVYPLYIWLLIVTIVLASWYSSFVAKITTSNTVSVLATMLLLSYAKLLKTSIETFSSVRLSFLDGEHFQTVWKGDGSIPFLGRVHMPLFLMSLLVVIVYIVPFTLLIFLGPLLRTKSHYRILRWIHKIKPFLDAFYGPYTIRYRYWPGLMLLTRLVIIGIFASYSTNDIPFKLMAVSMMVLVLFVLWLVFGRTHTVSFYRKQRLNYLELFFLFNLGVIAVVSLYIAQFTDSARKLRQQQTLAVVLVGSVLIVVCCIITYQIAFKFRAMQKVTDTVQTRLTKLLKIRHKTPQNIAQLHETAGDIASTTVVKTTHTVVDLISNKLREPLLSPNL